MHATLQACGSVSSYPHIGIRPAVDLDRAWIEGRMLRRMLLVAAACALLSGCALPVGSAVPTPYSPAYLPTVIHMTAEAIEAATSAAMGPTQAPSPTPTESATLVPPTSAPSATPTAGPAIPLAQIQIKAPGPMSRVISPLQIQMMVVAGESKRVEIDLFGEDGSLLGRRVLAVVGSAGGDPLSVKIPFEIRAAGENGFIQVSTDDARGRVQSLTTLQILLLSSGSSQITPAGNAIYERVVLPHLETGADVSGGVVQLDGQVLPYNRQPIVIQLMSTDGKYQWLRVLTTTGTDWQSFSTTVPYKVTAPTPARLYFQQADDVLSTPAYVYSQEILLNP